MDSSTHIWVTFTNLFDSESESVHLIFTSMRDVLDYLDHMWSWHDTQEITVSAAYTHEFMVAEGLIEEVPEPTFNPEIWSGVLQF